MPEKNGLVIAFTAGTKARHDLPELGVQILLGELVRLHMGPQRAVGKPLAALPPVVHHDLVHDVGERELHRAHGAVGNHEGALLYPFRLQHGTGGGQPCRLHHDVRALHAGLPVVHHANGLSEIFGKSSAEGLATFRTAGMDAYLLKIEQRIKQTHVPVGGSPGTYVTEHAGIFSGHVFRTESGHRAGAHVRDGRGVEHGLHHAGLGIEQVHDRHFRREILLVVVHIVSHDFHARHVQRLNIAAQHVEMTLGGIFGHKMHPRLDAGLSEPLSAEALLHGRKNFGIGHVQSVDVGPVEIGKVAFLHGVDSRSFR